MGKRKPRGRNYTPDERALVLRVITQGGTIDEVNDQLRKHQLAEGLSTREMPDASYAMMKNTYLRYLQDDDAIKQHMFHPSPMGKLRERESLTSE